MFMWVSWHWQRLCLLDNIWQPHEEVRWLNYILHFTIFLTKYLDINIAGFTIGMEKRWLLALIKSTVLEKRKCVSKTKRQCRHSKYKKMCQMRMEIWNRCNMFFLSLFSAWTSAHWTFLCVISSPVASLLHYFLYVSPVVVIRVTWLPPIGCCYYLGDIPHILLCVVWSPDEEWWLKHVGFFDDLVTFDTFMKYQHIWYLINRLYGKGK